MRRDPDLAGEMRAIVATAGTFLVLTASAAAGASPASMGTYVLTTERFENAPESIVRVESVVSRTTAAEELLVTGHCGTVQLRMRLTGVAGAPAPGKGDYLLTAPSSPRSKAPVARLVDSSTAKRALHCS